MGIGKLLNIPCTGLIYSRGADDKSCLVSIRYFKDPGSGLRGGKINDDACFEGNSGPAGLKGYAGGFPSKTYANILAEERMP